MKHIQCDHEETSSGNIVHFGCAGHFIGRAACRWHLHTHCGPFCISTIGDYRYPGRNEEQVPLGSAEDELYESMVFHIEQERSTVTSRYKTEQEAELGHVGLVQAYHRMSP